MDTNGVYHSESLKNSSNKRDIYNKWSIGYDTYVQSLNYSAPKTLMDICDKYINSINTRNNIISENNIHSIKNKTIHCLDFGCGTGLLGEEIKSRYKNITLVGIDISEGMIRQCEQKGIYDKLLCKNIIDNTISHDYLINKINGYGCDLFDIVFCCGTFLEGHMSLTIVLSHLYYLLNKGGLLCFTVRDSYFNDNTKIFNLIINNPNIRLLQKREIGYLDGVSAWGIILEIV